MLKTIIVKLKCSYIYVHTEIILLNLKIMNKFCKDKIINILHNLITKRSNCMEFEFII